PGHVEGFADSFFGLFRAVYSDVAAGGRQPDSTWVEFTDDDFLRFNALEVQEIDREGELLEPDVMRFFGWAEIERGSLNVIRFAFQSTPNTPAPIPGRPPIDVPEPASLPLMALGAAGLFAMRRKMAA
ncbi:MAG: PEP-CTERM sorting domain-containing protein, partial [Pseudomonadota bacterium]